MASNMKANDGSGRVERIAALAREDGDQLDVANNQANMFIRNNLANLAAADRESKRYPGVQDQGQEEPDNCCRVQSCQREAAQIL